MPAINPLPTPPSRNDPANFSGRADAFLAALPTYTSEANALLNDVHTSRDTVQTLRNEVIAAGLGSAAANAATATTKAAEAASSASEAFGYLQAYRATSYGALAADPVVDPNGNPPTVGDEYFNTSMNLLKRFNGVTWQASDIATADLAAPGGAAMVGYDDGTAQAVLDEAKPMANYTALRAYTGRATGVRITQTGLAGFFQRDDADTTSSDNGGTIIVDASGRRWKRLFSGAVHVKWFGAKGDWNGSTGTDDTPAIRAAFAEIKAAGGGKVVFTAGKNYRTTGYVGTDANNPADLIHYCRVEGFGATLTLNANTSTTDALCLEGRSNEVHGLTVNSTRTIDHNANLTPQRTPYQYGIVIGGKGHLHSPRSLGSLSDFVSGALVRGCTVTNFNIPIQAFRAEDVEVAQNTVDQFTDTGILVDDCTTNINVFRNRVTRGGDDCIFVRHYPNSPWATDGRYIGGLRIQKNWLQYTFGKCGGVGGYSDVSISDNDALDCWAGAFNVEVTSWTKRSAEDNSRIHITHNRIHRPGRYWGAGKLKTAPIGNNQDCGIHSFYNNDLETYPARHIKVTDNIIVNPYRSGISMHAVVDCAIERNKIVSGTYNHGAGEVVSQGLPFVVDQVRDFTLIGNTVDTDLPLVPGQNAFAGGTFSISDNSGKAVIKDNPILSGTTTFSNSEGTVTHWDIRQEFISYTTDAAWKNILAFACPDSAATFSRMQVVGVQDANANRAWYEKEALHHRAGGAAPAQQLATIRTEQESNAAWDCGFTTSGNNIIGRVLGAAGVNVTWRSIVQIQVVVA